MARDVEIIPHANYARELRELAWPQL